MDETATLREQDTPMRPESLNTAGHPATTLEVH